MAQRKDSAAYVVPLQCSKQRGESDDPQPCSSREAFVAHDTARTLVRLMTSTAAKSRNSLKNSMMVSLEDT